MKKSWKQWQAWVKEIIFKSYPENFSKFYLIQTRNSRGEREEASVFNLILTSFANCLANKFMHINYISNEKYLQMHLFSWQSIDWACKATIYII